MLTLKKINKTVIENAGEDLVSLYLLGSFMTKDIVRTSDIDFIAVMKDKFNFKKEKRLNRILNEKVRAGRRIDVGTMSINEFYGGKVKGSILKNVELPILLNFLKNAKLIYGRKLDFDSFPTKPASLKEELRYYAGLITRYGNRFRHTDKLGVDWTFRNFVKTAFFLANVELQLNRDAKHKKRYVDIVKTFRHDKEHIVHRTMKIRIKKTITQREKIEWINEAEMYARQMKRSYL